VVRIFGRGTEELNDRARELRLMNVAAAQDLGPHVEIVFENGFFTRYLPGETLSPPQLRESRVSSAIARTMAALHSISGHTQVR
jgi:aminoglycoside phosphotransferase (APT) family kinase protein